jgi:hypothetical protein
LESKFEKSPHWHFKEENIVLLQAKNIKAQQNLSANSFMEAEASE